MAGNMVVHRDKLKWLFWLRWKMLTRNFARSPWSIVGSIFLFLFVLGGAVGISIPTYLGYRFLDSPANGELLTLVLLALWLIWIVLPLLEYTVNEGLDVSKLTLYPVTRAEIMASLLFSTLLDIPTLGLILLLAAVVAGWWQSVAVGLLALATMLVFYVQVVTVSQLVLAVLMRTLQSRRFRDFSIIIIAVFSSSCYLIQQFVLGGSRAMHLYENLQHGAFTPYVQWLPPGMAARSVQLAAQGNWLLSLGWLALLLAISAVMLYLWQIVLEHSLSTPEVGGGARRVRRGARRERATALAQPGYPASAAPAPAAATGLLNRLFAPQMRAIVRKDLLYFWRDPQLKALLFQSVIYIAVFIVGPLVNPSSGSVTGRYILIIAPLVVLLFTLSLSMNVLGLERQALTTLFLFPIDPRRILWGKNLAIFLLGLGELLILLLVCGLLSQQWLFLLPALVLGLAGMGVTLGMGNVTSVFFPQFVKQSQRGVRATGSSAGSAGCLRGIMQLLMMLATVVVLLPVLAGIGLPLFFQQYWIWAISMPLSLVYGIACHQVASRVVAPRILDHAPEILAITTRE